MPERKINGKKAATKARSRKRSSVKKQTQPTKDKDGGLTAAGRRYFKEQEGANLKPGVKGKADTPEKMKRKGSFLRRHFAHPRGPLKDNKGAPTRLALSAQAWGEKAPRTKKDTDKLARKGSRLLEEYKKRAQSGAKRTKRRTNDGR